MGTKIHLISCCCCCCLLALKTTFKMVNIKFNEYSLLYGYSCLWLTIQPCFPTLAWPKLSLLKNRHVFHDIPKFEQTFMNNTSSWSHLLFICLPYIKFFIGSYQVLQYYVTFLIISRFSAQNQKHFLHASGVNTDDELSYKVLYYTPQVQVSIRITLLDLRQTTKKETNIIQEKLYRDSVYYAFLSCRFI